MDPDWQYSIPRAFIKHLLWVAYHVAMRAEEWVVLKSVMNLNYEQICELRA